MQCGGALVKKSIIQLNLLRKQPSQFRPYWPGVIVLITSETIRRSTARHLIRPLNSSPMIILYVLGVQLRAAGHWLIKFAIEP